MNKQTLSSSCPLAPVLSSSSVMKNLKNEGHIFSEANEIFEELTLKFLSTIREKEDKEEIDSRLKFRARMDLLPSFPSSYKN